MQISYYKRVKDQLENELREIDSNVGDINERYYRAIECIHACLFEMKYQYLESPYMRARQQVYFFKRIKPVILGELIYLVAVKRYRACVDIVSVRSKYLNDELEGIHRFLSDNVDFDIYMSRNYDHMDTYYFIGSKNLAPKRCYPESLYFICPYCVPEFSSWYDNLLAFMIAAKKMELFILRELKRLDQKLLN